MTATEGLLILTGAILIGAVLVALEVHLLRLFDDENKWGKG